MQAVFDTTSIQAKKRFSAWQETICQVYAKVDVKQMSDGSHAGRVEQGRLGVVNYTLASGTPYQVRREKEHLSSCQNDSIFIQLAQSGECDIEQHGHYFSDTRGRAIVFTVAEPYLLNFSENFRSIYIEIDRRDIEKKSKIRNIKCLGALDLATGSGRLFHDYCMSTYRTYDSLGAAEREIAGSHIVDLFVLAASKNVSAVEDEVDVREARKCAIRLYIDNNFHRPALSPALVAKENGISIRYLHNLFEDTNETISEIFWNTRLQRSRDLLRSPKWAMRTITSIAYTCGFSSCSHFSNLFKARFGETPTEFRSRVASEWLADIDFRTFSKNDGAA